MAERKVPRIRFKGFEEDWEQRKFADMFDCSISNNTFSRAQLSYDEGMVFNIHYGDILTKYGAILDLQTATMPYIVEGEMEEFKNSLLQEGDIVIADTAEDETAGKACEISNLQGTAIVAGLHTVVGRPKIKMAIGYLGYYLNSEVYHNQLVALMQGIKVLSLSRYNIQNTKISFPIIEEQGYVAEFLFCWDTLLSLHQRKLEKLKILKKAMLEKMFPKNGAKVPEIRFSGFPDDWEQRKLGEIASEIVAGGDVNKKSIQEVGKYPVIANALTDGGIIGYYNEEYRISAPALTVTGRGDIGHAKVRLVNFTPVVRLLAIKAKHDMFFLENNINIKKAITESTGVPQLTIPQLAKYELFIPKKRSEEESVGMLFKYIDSLLSLHQRKLEKLRQIKKSMLERMFV